MKNRSSIITLIIILSVLCIALTGGFVYLLVNGEGIHFNFNLSFKQMDLVDSYEVLPNDITSIEMNLYSTDVEIKESTNDKILVEYYSNKDNNPKIEYTDNNIKINENNYNVGCIGFCNNRRKVVLNIPSNYYGEYIISTKSGDILSNIDLTNSITKISTMSGDVRLNIVGNIEISTMSGDIKIDKINDTIKVKTTSGDILISELNIKENSSINTTSGDVLVSNNNSNCYVDVKTLSGDKYINKSDRKSDLVLTINTTSGDVRVN